MGGRYLPMVTVCIGLSSGAQAQTLLFPSSISAILALSGNTYNTNNEGIVCDGTTSGVGTDNAAALASLMTKAGAAAASGRSVAVYFPPQSAYCLTSTRFLVPSNVSLFANPETVVLAPTTGNVGSTMLLGFASAAQNVLISGLAFDGGLTYSTPIANTARVILAFGGVGNIKFDKIAMRNTRGIAMEISTNVQDLEVSNSTFTNIGNYWKTSLSQSDAKQAINADCASPNTSANWHKNLRVRNSRFDNIGLDPIAFCNTKGGEMVGNTVTNTDVQFTTVSSPAFPGLYVLQSTGIRVENNTVDGEPGNCFDIAASSDLVITGNRAMNCGQGGYVLSGSNIALTGNLAQDVWKAGAYQTDLIQRAGITMIGPASNITVTGNLITDHHTQAGMVSNGSAVVSRLSDTTYLAAGMTVLGAGIPAATTILTVDNPQQITLSANATVDGKPTALTFGTVTTNTAITNAATAATVSSATGLSKGMAASGTGIEVGTVIASITGTAVTLSRPALATNGTASLTFSAATTQYCIEGIGTPAAIGGLTNVSIGTDNLCTGPAAAAFTPANATTGRVALTTGVNY